MNIKFSSWTWGYLYGFACGVTFQLFWPLIRSFLQLVAA